MADEAEQDPTLQGMAAEHALLGFLALSAQGAGHGYELARHFEVGAPQGSVIRLEPGMVYHHLKKLDRLGWVIVLADEQGRATLLNPETSGRLVREQRQICLRLIESLSERLPSGDAANSADSPERRFAEMVLDLRLAQTRAALDWLDSIQHGSHVVTIDDIKRR